MSNRIKKQKNTKNDFLVNASTTMSVFVLIVLCIFPLVFRDYYYNILETKYQFYCACVIVAMVVMVGVGLLSGHLEKYFRNFKLKREIKKLNFVDLAMVAFWLSNVMSWLFCSDWRWEAFWGTSGRFNGVFLVTLYLGIYFLLTRFFRFRQWYLDAFLAASIFVCIFGITDYFQMDILGFKRDMLAEQRAIYTSTLGNINTYTVYVGAVMVVSMILFTLEKDRKRMLWYFGNLLLSSFALIMGTSDNAYLTLAALFGLSPLLLFRTKTGIRRYMIALAGFMTVIQCVDWINAANAGKVLGIDSAFNFIANFSGLPYLVIGIWVVAVAIAAFTLKKKKNVSAQTEEVGKWLFYVWISVIVIVVAAFVFVIYDANFAGHADRYGAIQAYVVFNDSWGTERGYVWRRSLDLYQHKYKPIQKIFGYGPDTFGLLMRYYYDGKKMNGQPVIFDSAHNEYIHYLMTLGIVGLVSYLAFMGSAIVQLIKNMKDRPEVIAVLFVVAAYSVQAVVNINIPIATPIVMTLLMMGLSVTIKSKE